MNEIRVINEFTMDKALFTEGMQQVIRENYVRSVRRLIAGLFVLWLGLAAFTLVRGGTLFYALAELAVLLAAAFWALFYIPRRKVRKAWKEMEEQYGPEIGRRVTADGEQLESRTGGRTYRTDLRDISQILHSEDLLILIDGQKKGILLKKDAYLSGNEEQLLHLLAAAKETAVNTEK